MAVNSRNGNTLLEGGFFAPVRVATTAAIVLSGLQTIDAVVLVEGDRVLVKDQADATTNGIYAASSGNWVRTTDALSSTDFFAGMAVVSAFGAANGGLTFVCTSTDDPVVIGTSSLTFESQQSVIDAPQSATSASALAIGTGSKVFATQSGKLFAVDQWVLAYSASNVGNTMLGQIASYAGGTLTLNVVAVGGAGSVSDWNLVLTNSRAAAGLQPPVGTGNVAGPGSATAGHIATFADATGKVLQDGGAVGNLATLSLVDIAHTATAALSFGLGMINGTIVASVAAGALSVAVKTRAGADPSAADPVAFLFRDSNAAIGDYYAYTVASALSMTLSAGSTMGFLNSAAGRLWLVAFDDAGTVRLGLINCLQRSAAAQNTFAAIFPLGAWGDASSLADDGAGGSDSAAQFYTSNGHAVTLKAYATLGYLTWESGLAAVGTWTAPTRIQLFGPGVPLPGRSVQIAATTTYGQTGISTTGFVPTAMSTPIALSSAANAVKFEALGMVYCTAPANGQGPITQVYRNSGAVAVGSTLQIILPGGTAGASLPTVNRGLDVPQASNWPPTEYNLYCALNTAIQAWTFGGNPPGGAVPGSLTVEEIMA